MTRQAGRLAGRGGRSIVGGMTWTWQYEKADGTASLSRNLPKESFGSQGDAETWLGEQWRTCSTPAWIRSACWKTAGVSTAR